MTKPELALGMESLFRAFGRGLSDKDKRDAMDVFWLACEQDADGAFLFACGRTVQEWVPAYGRSFPVPAEVRAKMPGAMGAAQAAQAAWLRVQAAARDGPFTPYNPGGGGGMPTGEGLDDVALSAIGHRAGLRAVQEAMDEPARLTYLRRDFLAAYEPLAANVAAGMLPDGTPRRALGPGQDCRQEVRALTADLGAQFRLPERTPDVSAAVTRARQAAARSNAHPSDPDLRAAAELEVAVAKAAVRLAGG